MDFRTPITISLPGFSIGHTTKGMLFGSCFSENIGAKLIESKFPIDMNPFGISYNPSSISSSIRRLLQRKGFTDADLLAHRGLYCSLMHHGSFSSTNKQACLDTIQQRFNEAADFIRQAQILLITFGTAYAYYWKETGEVVNNCHKFPAEAFDRKRLSMQEITDDWSDLIALLKEINPEIKIIFTVSPIRHWKDGAHENTVSKSILQVSVEALMERFGDNVFYFPAYEIMMDELRDYRFYAGDMLHPSNLAIDYIWERFSDTYFSASTKEIIQEWETIRKALNHRPLHPENESYRDFLLLTRDKLRLFSNKYPFITCTKEIDDIDLLLTHQQV
mgnify:FL=1